MRRAGFTDSEIFFSAVLGMATVLLTLELLVGLAGPGEAVAPATLDPPETVADALMATTTLVALVAPAQTVRYLYVFFVLIPAALAFFCIGVPFALRTLVAAVRRQLDQRELLGVAGLVTAGLLLIVETRLGTHGLMAIGVAAAVSAWQAGPALSTAGRRLAFRLVGLGGLALAGLAYYEQRALAVEEQSVAIAPTFLVAAGFFLAVGLVLVALAALRPGARFAALACWLTTVLWYHAPVLARASADDMAGAHRAELGATVAAALVVVGLALAREAREYRLRDEP